MVFNQHERIQVHIKPHLFFASLAGNRGFRIQMTGKKIQMHLPPIETGMSRTQSWGERYIKHFSLIEHMSIEVVAGGPNCSSSYMPWHRSHCHSFLTREGVSSLIRILGTDPLTSNHFLNRIFQGVFVIHM